MKLYAISDLHLAFQVDKPMDIFNPNWKDHHNKIRHYWENKITDQDVIIIGGDISWGMKLQEATTDLAFLSKLPGTKIIIKGNHDYWWDSISKVRQALPDNIIALQNDFYSLDKDKEIAICGTRGWHLLEQTTDPEHDHKMRQRELHRLELSLQSAWKQGYQNLISVLHYPPLYKSFPSELYGNLMKKYNVKICIYGHLHGKDHKYAFTGMKNGIAYYFTASDYLDFEPIEIPLQKLHS